MIVEASDIPILSSTDRLQRALLRWVDVCGLSGQFVAQSNVVDALSNHSFLDEGSYLVEMEGANPAGWSIAWAGAGVSFAGAYDFREALLRCIPDERFLSLVAREYTDAIRYRRASARRFEHRSEDDFDSIDQLIFPLRDAARVDFVLVVGEGVRGRSPYLGSASADQGDAR